MLELVNETPYEAERAVLVDLDGSEIWVLAVKATFMVGETLTLADEQEKVCLVDEYFGEPGRSSVKYEGELVFRKPGTDVIINGHAYAPKDRPTTRLDVDLNIAGRRKTIRVNGNRVWTGGAAGLSMTSPEPFRTMPLVYERAFGGTDTRSENPKEHAAEYRNPIGAGFATTRASLNGRPLPNLEDPADEVTSWNSRPNPVGVGFTAKHWEPRRRYAGTCDDGYIRHRLPLYPLDFDLRFFQGAWSDLVFTPHLRGGEAFELHHVTPEGYFGFVLPRIVLGFRTLIGTEWIDHRATLGSVVIEPDARRVMLTFQTFVPCHRQALYVEETRIFEKQAI